MRVSPDKAIGKIAMRDKKETLVFFDAPWSNTHSFRFDFPACEDNFTVISTSAWETPELYNFFRNIGAKVYTTPSLVHFKDGRVFATLNGCGQINTHLNIYLTKRENNESRTANSASKNPSSKRARNSRKGRKGSRKPNPGYQKGPRSRQGN